MSFNTVDFKKQVDVSSYWMTLTKREDTGYRKLKEETLDRLQWRTFFGKADVLS
jgi:hypothetical protein